MTFSERMDDLCKSRTWRIVIAGVASGIMTFVLALPCVFFYQLYAGAGILQSALTALGYSAGAGWILMFAGFIIKDYDESMHHLHDD